MAYALTKRRRTRTPARLARRPAAAGSAPGPQRRRWTRDEYYRMAEAGILQPDERVELIEGEIWQMAPQGPTHSTGTLRLHQVIALAFREGHHVRPQLPLALGKRSDPEPDVAVVPGSIDDYEDAHPTTAVLVVEVADSTLALDRKAKGSLYASAGIPEYWILNVVDDVVEVYRDPVEDASAPSGARYRDVSVCQRGTSIVPIRAPQPVPIAVDAILPRRPKPPVA